MQAYVVDAGGLGRRRRSLEAVLPQEVK